MTADLANPYEAHDSCSQHRVIGLREWGTDHVHPLPARALRCALSTDERRLVRLSHPNVFPSHAHLTRERRQWLIRALGDTPGLLRDGVQCDAFSLQPGVEIGLDGATLIAESEHWIALRRFCARILGWRDDCKPIVDRALRALRLSTTHRAPLLLRGDSDLIPIAHALHCRTLGADRPFVVCDPRRRNVRATAHAQANYEIGMVAVEEAKGGSLCVWDHRLPRDFSSVLARIREPDASVQLIVCSLKIDGTTFLATPVEVPPLRKRHKELPRIVDEYVVDAIVALNAPMTSLTAVDRAWVLTQGTSLPEIEKATLRLVALRSTPNLTFAAARLRMARASLAEWVARGKVPTRAESRSRATTAPRFRQTV